MSETDSRAAGPTSGTQLPLPFGLPAAPPRRASPSIAAPPRPAAPPLPPPGPPHTSPRPGRPSTDANAPRRPAAAPDAGPTPAPAVAFVRHRRARHYVLRMRDDGSLRVTVPRGGSRAGAERFVRERRDWIARERVRRSAAAAARGAAWQAGTLVLLRGVEVPIEIEEADGRLVVTVGSERLTLPASDAGDLRATIEAHLRAAASRELPERLQALAREHGVAVAGVTVRGQRTRWGSCSRAGRISLNWRLIQLPPGVRDYVCLHELAHVRHHDHSPRFHRELARLCPGHAEARRWLRASKLLEG